MLIKAPKRKRLSSIQSTEEHAPILLGVRKLPFERWYDLYKAAAFTGFDTSILLRHIIKSTYLHAVQASDGTIYVHPDGLIRFSKNRWRSLTKAIAKRIYRKHLQARVGQS